jgi:hypothetical protein
MNGYIDVISVATNIISIAQAGIGQLKKGRRDLKIEHIFTTKTDKQNEWIVIVAIANHGNREAQYCKCYIEASEEKPIYLQYPIVETEKGSIYSKDSWTLAGGGVREVRGYVTYWGKKLKVILEVNGTKVDEVPIPLEKY